MQVIPRWELQCGVSECGAARAIVFCSAPGALVNLKTNLCRYTSPHWVLSDYLYSTVPTWSRDASSLPSLAAKLTYALLQTVGCGLTFPLQVGDLLGVCL